MINRRQNSVAHVTPSRDERQLLVLYGRRRVGKTTLVTTALENLEMTSVYYLCDQRGSSHNARRFAAQCADAFGDITPDVDDFAERFTISRLASTNRASLH